MLATGSSRTDRLLVAAWALSATINVVLMWRLPGAETIPFHLVWIGLAIVYGFTTWRLPAMSLTLCLVAITTSYVLMHHADGGWIGWEEVSEVPLMSALFVIMVWHVRRRQFAMAELARLAKTERRRAEVQQLFVRFASHELRTPITIARGYTELIKAAGPALGDDATIVIEELDKLARITQRLVTLMQVEGGHQRSVGDVDAALTRILHRWEPTAARCWSVASTIGTIEFNQDRLSAAVDCLVENAVKFTGEGDRIAVTGHRTPQYWAVSVRDTGCGIDAAQMAALTIGNAPVWSASGTGLGLAIARAVATSWGGELSIQSELGVGTCVELRVPWMTTARDGLAGSLFATGLAETSRRPAADPAAVHAGG